MHKIPNLLAMPDLFLFGLTVRQGLLLLVGVGTGYLLFLHIFALFADPTLALLAGLCAALLLLGVTLMLVFLQRGGRGLEEWGIVLLLYATRPRVYGWHLGLRAWKENPVYRTHTSARSLERASAGDQRW
jgi:hypothetical protein